MEQVLSGILIAGLSGAIGFALGLKKYARGSRKNCIRSGSYKVDLTGAQAHGLATIGQAMEAKQPGLPRKLREKVR